MLEQLSAAPPDAILGLNEAFTADPNPAKVNLGVGVYVDDTGTTPVLETVREAQQRVLSQERTKNYLPIAGLPAYGKAVRELYFGADHELASGGRAMTAQTPGGTGALRVGADFLRGALPEASVWLSRPTWPNHRGIFAGAGFACREYPYYDPGRGDVDFDGVLEALSEAPAGDIVLLHACCHNPTGADLDAAQWERLGALLAERDLLPFLDFAYQGFGSGIAEDREALLRLAEHCPEFLVAGSFSKNFGLYRERVGGLTLAARNRESAETAFSRIRISIRTLYSNPPAHGGLTALTVLEDPSLRARWEKEVDAMRLRIAGVREKLVAGLKARGVAADFSALVRQRGMFSYSGLNDDQVRRLREEKSIYIVKGGRINVAGLTSANLDRVCDAVAGVLQD